MILWVISTRRCSSAWSMPAMSMPCLSASAAARMLAVSASASVRPFRFNSLRIFCAASSLVIKSKRASGVAALFARGPMKLRVPVFERGGEQAKLDQWETGIIRGSVKAFLGNQDRARVCRRDAADEMQVSPALARIAARLVIMLLHHGIEVLGINEHGEGDEHAIKLRVGEFLVRLHLAQRVDVAGVAQVIR